MEGHVTCSDGIGRVPQVLRVPHRSVCERGASLFTDRKPGMACAPDRRLTRPLWWNQTLGSLKGYRRQCRKEPVSRKGFTSFECR